MSKESRPSRTGPDPNGQSLFKVKEMDPSDKPREKLMKNGANSLSESELLAILLRTGTRRMNVLDLGRWVLMQSGGLRQLTRKNWEELAMEPGIGSAKAVTLEAVFELGRRIQQTKLGDRPKLRSPQEAAAYFRPKIRDLNKEVFIVAFLNNSKILTGSRRISEGGMTATVVDPAEVYRQAILNNAASIIVAHNHPSGMVGESHADRLLTRRLHEVGRILGVPLDDHIIIAGDTYLSFRERNLMG